MQMMFANPAFSGPQQLRFRFSMRVTGEWPELQVNRSTPMIRDMIGNLASDRCLFGDPSEIAIAMALGVHPSEFITVQDLLRVKEPEELYPSKPNRILHQFAMDILREVVGDARNSGIALDHIPRSRFEAWERRISGHLNAPPWISNREALDVIEKSVRMRIYELFPSLQEAARIEEDLYRCISCVFLATGWHLVDDDPHRLPPPHKLPSGVSELIELGLRRMEDFNSINWGVFIEAMMIPGNVHEVGDGFGRLVPTSTGMFIDTEDVEAEDFQIIADGVRSLLYDGEVHFTTDGVLWGHIERIYEFQKRCSPSPVTAAARA